ncbi:MAG: hypothetical protein IPO15_27350 [Anaerolineae bacterium]|uniref:hypothetical protein n=1 Tax=Candidatus Amarolinea dominans TaxID=3140696 RepID=UPI003135CDD6|nr:hypothetical protein [Anaerolineae bacterium]
MQNGQRLQLPLQVAAACLCAVTSRATQSVLSSVNGEMDASNQTRRSPIGVSVFDMGGVRGLQDGLADVGEQFGPGGREDIAQALAKQFSTGRKSRADWSAMPR